MWKILLALAVSASPALAQVDGGTAPGASGDMDEVRREVDRRVESAKKEMREEMRAQLATQSAAQGWNEEWVERNRKLDLLELNGYFRVRPDLFNKFDLNRQPDPSGYTLWPTSPLSNPVLPSQRTQIGANMRLRLDPTLNVSEEVRVRAQIDVLDNLIWGSTPDYAFAMQQRLQFGVFSNSQNAPVAGLNSNIDSLLVKRVWGEVSTPVGILRFGRMGSQWGLGAVHNDGNCPDCDYGETVDRVQFVAEPLTGFYVAPALDVNLAGLTSSQQAGQGAQQTNVPYVLSNTDQTLSGVLVLARRDTEQQAKAKLESGQAVFNYGLHFTYRVQHRDPVAFYNSPYGSVTNPSNPPLNANGTPGTPNPYDGLVDREATLFLPDLWAKYERKAFRIEVEAAALLGTINNHFLQSNGDAYSQSLSVTQFTGIAQGEYRFLDGQLRVGLELGYVSGDNSPGRGIYQGRTVGTAPYYNTPQYSLDGPKYTCQGALCSDSTINNFVLARDYRIDNILFRELFGGVTDALYLKPSIRYQVADGFDIFGGLLASRSLYAQSTPSGTDPYLGVELNAGVSYQTEDGFFAQLTYAVLFPLSGMGNPPGNTTAPGLDTAQALRGLAGIKF